MVYSKQKATWWAGTIYHREQLDEVLQSTDVRSYAWILHDKDIDKESGEPKKPHYHYLIQFVGQQRGSWFKQFYADDKGHILHRACYAPEGAYNYLIHDTPACRKEGKHLYDKSEVVSTLESFASDDDNERKITLTRIRELVLTENVTPGEILLKYEVNNQLADMAKRLYIEYMNKKFKSDFRNLEVTYIWGSPETGKSRYATDKYGFSGVYENSGYARRGWFDNYDYQDVLLLDEFKGQWDIEFLIRILDGRPFDVECRYQNKQACYTKVFITSNMPLDSLYTEKQQSEPKTWQGLMRRIHYVWQMGAQVERQPNPHYDKNKNKKTVQVLMPIDDDGSLPF